MIDLSTPEGFIPWLREEAAGLFSFDGGACSRLLSHAERAVLTITFFT